MKQLSMIDVHLGKRRPYKRSSDLYRRGRHGHYSLALCVSLIMMLGGRANGENVIECCTESYAPVEYCTAPIDIEGQVGVTRFAFDQMHRVT